jgi:ABC-2 type transport system permease protein
VSLAAVQPRARLGYYVWKLLRLRWRIFFSGLRRARPGRQIGYLVLALLALAVPATMFGLSWLILRFLRSPEAAKFVNPALFLDSVPVLIVSIAFGVVLLFSFGVLLQALYLAGDMDFLLSAPVPIRAVFIAKLLQAILPNLGLISLFGLPVLFGLGAAGGYNVLYYPLVVIVLGAVALAAAGLASLLVMGVVRVFPARRVAEILAVAGGLLSLVCSQAGQIGRSVDVSSTQASQALGALALLNTPWSPLAWAGRGLVDIGQGLWLPGIGFLVLTLGLAGAVFVVALTSAERLYYTGWARMQSGTRRKKPRRMPRTARAKRKPMAGLLEGLMPAAVRGLMVKDALVLRRDLRNMSQLLSPLILGLIYAAALVRGGGPGAAAGQGEGPAWLMHILKNVAVYGNVGVSLFVGWSLMSRLAMMGFSHEGKHYWLLKSAPVSADQLLAAKFLAAYLPTLALGWGFFVVISLVQGARLATLLFGMPVVALSIAGGVGISLAFGVTGVNLEWDDPRHMTRGTTGCLGLLVSGGCMFVCLALFFGPPLGFVLLGWPETAGQLVGLALGGVASLACAILPPRLVRERVPRIGEV